MKWQIVYSDRARLDMRDLYEYIAYHLLEPGTARNQVRRIRDAIAELDFMPMRFPLYDEEPWRSQGLRCLSVSRHLVFYWVQEEQRTVTVARIMYGGRDIRKQLSEET